MNAADFIDALVASGRYHFTSDEAVASITAGSAAVRAQLRRLVEQGRIARPMRSFYVVVPPEYRQLGCLPADQFIDDLMNWLGESYYVGLLSAAERHGAAHQRPQTLQVMARRNRGQVACGRVRIDFIARHDLASMPVSVSNTPRGVIRYSTPEVTALELVGYPNHAGGLGNVATILSELAAAIDPGRLVDAAKRSPVGWSQRLGYLLEMVGHAPKAADLFTYVSAAARAYALLRRTAPVSDSDRNSRWKLILNTPVEPDL